MSKIKSMKEKKILYCDMDGVIADFNSAILKIDPTLIMDNKNHYDRVDQICKENNRIFKDLEPLPDAIKSVKELLLMFDCYFLSTPMWCVPESYTDKRLWIHNHFGDEIEKRLILTHRKDLCHGDYLIDDRKVNGVENFKGIHIHFGQGEFPNWKKVLKYFDNVYLKDNPGMMAII